MNGSALKQRKMEYIRSHLNGSADHRNFVMADVQTFPFFYSTLISTGFPPKVQQLTETDSSAGD